MTDILPTPSAMQQRQSWSRLIDDHDRIARHCATLSALTKRPDDASAEASRKLLELAVIVADHLGVEDEVADLTALAMESDHSAATIATMQADLDLLLDDWKTFVGRWLPVIRATDWCEFSGDMAAMTGRLVAQVGRENRLLYDKALRSGAIIHGAAAVH